MMQFREALRSITRLMWRATSAKDRVEFQNVKWAGSHQKKIKQKASARLYI
jgi:hypothetical protein